MRNPRLAVGLAMIAIITTASPVQAADGRLRLLIHDVKHQQVEKQLAGIVTEILLVEASRMPEFAVIARREVDETLAIAEQRQKCGDDDAACLAEIASALGADLLLNGSVGRLGEVHVVTLRLVDNRSVSSVGRIRREIKGGEEQFFEVVPEMVEQLFAPIRITHAPEGGTSGLGITGWTLAGVGAAAGIAGAVLGGLALQSKAEYDDADQYEDARRLHQDTDDLALAANVNLFSGLALGLAGATCLIIDLLRDDTPAGKAGEAKTVLLPGAGGRPAGVLLRF